MDCSTPAFPVHHQLPEFTQTHVHWVILLFVCPFMLPVMLQASFLLCEAEVPTPLKKTHVTSWKSLVELKNSEQL